MVLKTQNVLGTLNDYAMARGIEQISGDLPNVNPGTLYPVLLKLEQEGPIASDWGLSENNRKARFTLRSHRAPANCNRNPKLGRDGGHH